MPENPRPEPSRLYRWLVLIFVSLAMFGSYYAYDALSPIADVLKQQLGFSDLDIGFLQAIYSFPNIFTVLIGGFIIDRIGLRKSLMIFAVLCFIGPAITAASGRLPVMATGRLLVSRQRVELCLWIELDRVAPGYLCCTELSHLGSMGVCQLAPSIPDLVGFFDLVLGRSRRLLGHGGMGREKLSTGRCFHGQSGFR